MGFQMKQGTLCDESGCPVDSGPPVQHIGGLTIAPLTTTREPPTAKDAAVARVRARYGQSDMSEAEALRIISEFYLEMLG